MHEALGHHRERRRPESEYDRKRWVKIIDLVVYPIGIAGIIASLPQLLKIWMEQNADGLSAATWCMWSIFSLFWMLYGLAHKAPAIAILNGIWIFINASIALGAYLYG